MTVISLFLKVESVGNYTMFNAFLTVNLLIQNKPYRTAATPSNKPYRTATLLCSKVYR